MGKTYDLTGDVAAALTCSGTVLRTFGYDTRGEPIGSAQTNGSMPNLGLGEPRQHGAINSLRPFFERLACAGGITLRARFRLS